MERLLTKTKEFLFAKQTSILSSTLVIATMMIVARFFGLIKYRVFTNYFTTEEMDIYLAAFRIPDLIFEILITGAITTSFIPFFLRYRKNHETQSIQISSIMNIVFLVLGTAILFFALFLPLVMPLLTPGFTAEKRETVVELARILLLGQLPFLVFGNFLTGISQARKVFILPALAPIAYNLAIIIATITLHAQLHLYAPVLGVVAGAILFFLIQLPTLLRGSFKYLPLITFSKSITEFFTVTIPRVFTVLATQIDATIDLTLTTLMGPGSYSIFYFAQHLQLLPVSVIGMAYGQASLPYLSEVYEQRGKSEFKKLIADSLLNLLFFSIPIMFFLIFARTPLVRLLYGGSQFDWAATNLTALTVSVFAFGVPFHSMYYFLTRCYYAFFDSRTPFAIGLLCIGINGLLSTVLVLVFQMPVWALGFAFVISNGLNVLILFGVLHKRLNGFDLWYLIAETAKMGISAYIAAYLAYKLQVLLDGLIIETDRTINVFLLVCISGSIFFILYAYLSWFLGVKQINLISRMLLKVKEYQKKFVEVYRGIE